MSSKLYYFLIGIILIGNLSCDATNSKTEYAVLQNVEYDNRDLIISNVVIQEYNNYVVAGFRAENKKENVWVLLNSKSSPFYKQIPQSRFSLTTTELNKIKGIQSVTETVVAVLETRIVD